MAQRFTSGATSINGKQNKLPTLYNKVTFPSGSVIFDYGCGNGTELMQKKVEEQGCEWYGYDLVWKNDSESLKQLEKGVDIVVACNLLNVIDDVDTIKDIVTKTVRNSGQTIFQVYEGDKSGVGRQTGTDQWQRNCKRGWYEELIKELGYEVERATGNLIYVKGEKR